MPTLGLVRTPPPDQAACVSMGTRSLLLLPALMLAVSVGILAVVHALFLVNGLTTAQFARRWRARGHRSLRDLLLLHGEAETDKWRMLWGRPASSVTALYRARVVLVPSLPERRVLGPGIGNPKAWIGAAGVLVGLLLLLPLAASGLELAGRGVHALANGIKSSTSRGGGLTSTSTSLRDQHSIG
eukprot:CAMPEP_0115888242 /NCGR_PEP_ID=MMETSP0287-20121206/32204_1 /TAXON_ID=412157 /ORGANISM="Chrysochromulina rotalis, Strain UIO044" /LENGTH=184 /DNA_ID=CAMNT_0003344915 /DNA_START=468 /DNA_END=1022 /DNA_ORIENTATION=+